ncbi:YncE family protein [Streptomyces avidinii]|uniref:YVTN family beta-propeller protein n=1 Tax=Streptomyces avidinii TaxID=1895 RepID=A0ABS4KX75_STRAV|nr:hypothetical protein [Streptomyces avidinii]MBP2034623.1 YVTN family beta-propeller protein [Streptomyces avidinii]GGY87638.1 hypothetical protein GCM10010343_10920 [Streptomyces avidinii]
MNAHDRLLLDGARRGDAAAVGTALAAVLLLGACSPNAASAPPAPAPSAADPLPATAPTPQGLLLTADFGADTVTFVDPRHGAVASVAVGRAPYGLAVGADGRAWVATAEGVAVVDTRTRVRVALIPHRTGTGPVTDGEYRVGGMGTLSPDGAHAYVGVNVPGTTGVLEVLDTARREVTAVVPVGRRPFDVDVSRDGAEVYVTGHDSFDVTVVAATGTASRSSTWTAERPAASRRAPGRWASPSPLHPSAERADGAELPCRSGTPRRGTDPVVADGPWARIGSRTQERALVGYARTSASRAESPRVPTPHRCRPG